LAVVHNITQSHLSESTFAAMMAGSQGRFR
jgi:hypothetical protein